MSSFANGRHLQICAGKLTHSLTFRNFGGKFLLCVWELWLSTDFKMGSDMSRMHVCCCLFKKKLPFKLFHSLQMVGVWCMACWACHVFFSCNILTYIVQGRKFAWNKSSCDVHSHRIILSQRQQYKSTAEGEEGASMFPNRFMENHSHSKSRFLLVGCWSSF